MSSFDLNLNVTLTIQDGRATNAHLTRIEQKLDALLELEKAQMKEITDLETEVAEETTVINGAIVLLDKLSDLIIQANGDPQALKNITDNMRANKQALASALVRNTPAEVPAAA